MKKTYPVLMVLFLILLCLPACSKHNTKPGTDTTGAPAGTSTPTPTNTSTPTPTPLLAPDWDRKMVYYNDFAEGHIIPIVSVYTADRALVTSREEYVNCVVDVFNCDKQYEVVEAPAGIRVRGNSSAYYGDYNQIINNTVPYRIKFEEKQSMLGLNDNAECKSWVLLKTDWDLIRNDIALQMGQVIVDGHAYCSDSTMVYLYLNEKFQGIYVLCEQSQVNPERVDISEVPADYTGTDIGYFLEIDNYAAGEPDNNYFINQYANASVTDINGTKRQFVASEYSVKSDIYSKEQVNFIDQYINNLFTIMYEACINNQYYGLSEDGCFTSTQCTDAKSLIEQYVDLESVVNMYILHEIVQTYDIGEGSFYMSIDFSPEAKNNKLVFTCPWDFNWGFAENMSGSYYAGVFQSSSFVSQYGDRTNPWFVLLATQDWFMDIVKVRWNEIQQSGALAACIDKERAYVDKYAADLNVLEEWATGSSHELLDWIESRIEWLDSQWLIKTEE